jgi:hypothetical protein
MGVNFNSINNFEATVNALGTVMFAGFDPTPKRIARKYKISQQGIQT